MASTLLESAAPQLTGIREDLGTFIRTLEGWHELSGLAGGEPRPLSGDVAQALSSLWYDTITNLENLQGRIDELLPDDALTT
jgi:hypothetical protein